MGKFDLGALLQQQAAPAEGRSIEVITQEILDAKRAGGEAILTVGKGLIEAKAVLPEGKWLPYLAETVDFSPRTAQRLMRLAREWTDATALSHLGASKALSLLALPEAERKEFLSETHLVDGEEKNVIDMSSRQLEQAIRERDEARKAAEQAKADHKAAQQALDSMESSLLTANQLLEAAQKEKEQAHGTVAELEKQLAELKAAPVDVAVMEVDQAALDQARAEGEAAKAEEIAQLQVKLEKAQRAKEQAEEKQKEAEASLADANAKLEESAKAQKKAVIAADSDVSKCEFYFNQAKEAVNKMRGLLLIARGRPDQSAAGRMTNAILALSDAVKEAAK